MVQPLVVVAAVYGDERERRASSQRGLGEQPRAEPVAAGVASRSAKAVQQHAHRVAGGDVPGRQGGDELDHPAASVRVHPFDRGEADVGRCRAAAAGTNRQAAAQHDRYRRAAEACDGETGQPARQRRPPVDEPLV
ncbi:MAG: hypothetical protein GEU86_05290 [Actinophytocola sp.]|nr:hypothetical protein [Actinophytocola sp.]